MPVGVLEREFVLFGLTYIFSHGQCILDFLQDRVHRLNQIQFRRLLTTFVYGLFNQYL